MQVWINGEPRELADGARVPDALDELGAPRTGVAVAVDGDGRAAGGLGRRRRWSPARASRC